MTNIRVVMALGSYTDVLFVPDINLSPGSSLQFKCEILTSSLWPYDNSLWPYCYSELHKQYETDCPLKCHEVPLLMY